MRKTIAKTAALAMAVMLAGSVCAPVTAFAYRTGTSTTSDSSQVEMKAALTIVKKRVKIPAELSEFDYSVSENYNNRCFNFTWKTKSDASEYRSLQISIIGDTIVNYSDSKSSKTDGKPKLASLTEKQLLEKAKSSIEMLNPDMAKKVKLELGNMGLYNNNVTVNFFRYENGIAVSSNSGTVTIDKNTGSMTRFNADWWENASFVSPKSARSEEQIKEDYKKLCKLTPEYVIKTEYKTDEKTKKSVPVRTAKIVYRPDMTGEIDAFTGKESTIWDDMREAEGTRYYGGWHYAETEACVDEEAAAADAGNAESGVNFTPAELEKIQQDNNLIKNDKAFEQLKKDKYVALTDNYNLEGYDVYSIEDPKTGEESFYLSLTYRIKDELKDTFKGYKSVDVTMNAETGEIISFSKYSRGSSNQTKLNVTSANATAEAAAKKYAKNIISKYKADEANSNPVESWKDGTTTRYETERSFRFNRYENGIIVDGDYICVDVDSTGVVTDFCTNHTEDVSFVPNKIISESEALDKLYTQQDFEYYYDGWITKDGKVETYLLYKMDNFYLNANTGKLCSRNGDKPYEYVNGRDVKYSDIKGIKQEKAILELQKYGIVITNDSKFDPDKLVTEAEFTNFVSNALNGIMYAYVEEEEVEEEYVGSDKTLTAKAEAEKKDLAETTIREAAVRFGMMYLTEDIAKLSIFKSPFSDVKDSDEDAGYIAIANAKGFITGSNGKLNGEKKITRAEAVQIVYDYIKYLSE